MHAFTTMRGPRARLVGLLGEIGYKIGYSLVSVLGFYLIVTGFAAYREAGMIAVWEPPLGLRHAVSLLMLPAMILLVAAYAPAGFIKTRAKHPMLAAVKVWALAHLLANGDLGSVVLFGAFLAWAVYDRISLKRRADAPVIVPRGWGVGDAVALGVGAALWGGFLFGLHTWLIGVPVIR
jgi:uncharacterized membrane protein